MQTTTIQCKNCGCISMADSKSCPKCGFSYRNYYNKIDAEVKKKCSNINLFDVYFANKISSNITYQFIVCPYFSGDDINTERYFQNISECSAR